MNELNPLDVAWDGVARGYMPKSPPAVDSAFPLHQEVDVEIDPVTFEVIRYGLMNINLEHADLIQRLSLSPIVMSARDFQASLLTETADLVFLGAGVLYFSNQNALTIRYILEHRGSDGLAEDDIYLCNDPYIGASHQSDVTLAAPVFVDGRIFCWVSNAIHFQDVGGETPGSQCVGARDTWQEPMTWPPVRLVERGRLRNDIESLFVRQSRYPGLAGMDLRAGIGAIEATRRKIRTLVERHGAAHVKGVMHRVLDAGEELFVERLRDLPDGRWSHRAFMEAAVPGDRNTYAFQVNISKVGDRLIVDNEGSDPQTGSINLTFAGFAGCVQAAITQQMLPEQAGAYGGAFRRVEFRPQPGLVNCADHPAAVSPSGVFSSIHQLNVAANAVCKMLASGSDESRALSLGAPTPNLSSLIGAGLTSGGDPFMLIDANGLMGSLAGRHTRDGVDSGGQWWIPDATAQNSEEVEAQTPFVVLARELLPIGADGAGRHRAGAGFREVLAVRGAQVLEMVVYSHESFPRAAGLFGGNPGSLATCRVKTGTDLLDRIAAGELPLGVDDVSGDEAGLTYKGAPIVMMDGDVIEWTSPAAAGCGDPLLRDPQLVLADAEARLLTSETADRVYGVAIVDADDFGAFEVDEAATVEKRLARRRLRLGREPSDLVSPPTGAHQVGELLHVVDGRWWCNGADLGPVSDDYAREGIVIESPFRDMGPEFASDDLDMADRFVFREFICPVTGYRFDAEIARVDASPSLNIVLSSNLEGSFA